MLSPYMEAECEYLRKNTAYSKQRKFGDSVRNGTIILQIVVAAVFGVSTVGGGDPLDLISVLFLCMTTILITLAVYYVYGAILDIADAQLLARLEARQATQQSSPQKMPLQAYEDPRFAAYSDQA